MCGANMSASFAMPVDVRMVLELAMAEEIDEGMARVVSLLRQGSGAARVEWWAPDEDAELQLRVSDGAGRRDHRRFSLGRAGEVVVFGARHDGRVESAMARVRPIVRRRWVDEQLASAVTSLARRNEALEEFAALVAHELKTPLQAALVADDASIALGRALELIDSLIETGRDRHEATHTSAAVCLDAALGDLGPIPVEVTADVTSTIPLPHAPLRVILRNLLRNAVAAKARHIHVAAVPVPDSWRLLVDDDGVGLAAGARYTAGSGLGLSLCRRIADRYGGALDLAARPGGGTRATLQSARVS
jgi:signal transduction histidine kinase